MLHTGGHCDHVHLHCGTGDLECHIWLLRSVQLVQRLVSIILWRSVHTICMLLKPVFV